MKLENPPDEFYILLLKTSDASRCAVTVHDAVTDGRKTGRAIGPDKRLQGLNGC